jgi:1,4-alpha-glucan branching enzyme
MNLPNRPATQTKKSPTSTRPPFSGGPSKAGSQPKPAEGKPPSAQTQAAERAVRFELDIPEARNVSVVGTFNDWKPGVTRLTFIGGTRWFKDLLLSPGRYEYRFMVNGKWIEPPNAKAYVPNPHGGRNAVVEV